MDGMQQRGASGGQNIHMILVIQMSIIKGPVSKGGAWKERSVVRQVLDGTEYKGIS